MQFQKRLHLFATEQQHCFITAPAARQPLCKRPSMAANCSSNGNCPCSSLVQQQPGTAPVPAEAAAAPPPDWSVTQAGAARSGEAQRGDLTVVLVEPQIPQNTGNVARTCAATNVALHLVGPLGFEIDDKKLKRAGLDYWQHLCVEIHDSWESFFTYFKSLQGPKRLIGYSVYGSKYYAGPEFQYQPGDMLLFGAETTGLPLQAHEDIVASGGELVKIPIVDTYVRSLNQSVSVGVGVFEALRQLDQGQHHVTPRDDENNAMVKMATPMMMAQQQQQQQQPSSSSQVAATTVAASK